MRCDHPETATAQSGIRVCVRCGNPVLYADAAAEPAPDLITWLRTQFDEDERVARAAGARWYIDAEGDIRQDNPDGSPYVACGPYGGGLNAANAEHIIRNDPRARLAEVDAKRRIINRLEPFAAFDMDPIKAQSASREEWIVVTAARDAIKLLALPYADHEGYRDEWRP